MITDVFCETRWCYFLFLACYKTHEFWLLHGTRAKARTQLAQPQNKHHKQKPDPVSEARVLRRPLCTRAAALLQPTTTKRRVEERGEHCKLTWKTATRSDQFHAVSLQGFPAQISLVQPPEVVGCLENRKVTESQCASILTVVVNYNQLVVATIKPT